MPPEAISFVQPLRTSRGRLAVGSSLLDPATLRRLLVWPIPKRGPDVSIVLVDEDGDPTRYKTLLGATTSLRRRRIIGVARQEFEAWLLADHVVVGRAVGTTLDMTADPENMQPGRAKEILMGWLADPARYDHRSALRRTIAETADLAVVARRCAAFKRFLGDLATV